MLLENRVFRVFWAAWAVFFPAAIILPRPYLFDFVNAFTIALALGAIWAFWPAILDTWRRAKLNQHLVTGNFLASAGVLILLALSGRTIWIEVWRNSDRPDGMLDHVLFAFMAWAIVPSAIFQMASPDITEGELPRGGWAAVRISTLAGCVLFLAFSLWRWTHS